MRIGHLQPSRPEWYDRNPVAVYRYYQGASVNGGAGGTSRWTYTVPSGKKCYIDMVSARLNVQTRRTAAGFHTAVISMTAGAVSIDPVRVEVYENVYGAGSAAGLSNLGAMGAGDVLFAQDAGASTGDYNVTMSAKMTEFDA